MKAKILIVNYEMPPLGGGAGRVTYETVKRLSESYDMYILTSFFKKENIHPDKIKGVTIYSAPSYRTSLNKTGLIGIVSFLLFGAIKIKKLFKENNSLYLLNNNL